MNQAFVFNGSSSQIRVPATASLNVGLGSGLTFETWINPVNGNFAELMEYNQNNGVPSGSAQIGVHMEINESAGDGSFVGGIPDTAGIFHNIFSPTGLIIANSFQHVAMTFDKSSGVAVLYRNGVAVATTTFPGVFTPRTSFAYSQNPDGRLSQAIISQLRSTKVSIYNRALSASEMQAIHNLSSGKFDTNTSMGYHSVDDARQ